MLVIHLPAQAKSVAEVFVGLGWKVDVCTTSDCATRHVAGSEPYKVILLGYRVAGLPLVRFIRSLDHRMTTGIVTIADSAVMTDEAKAAGVDEVLIDPVTVSSLICAVNQHIP